MYARQGLRGAVRARAAGGQRCGSFPAQIGPDFGLVGRRGRFPTEEPRLVHDGPARWALGPAGPVDTSAFRITAGGTPSGARRSALVALARAFSGPAPPADGHGLPSAWEKTYAARSPEECLAAYADWAPTYDTDSEGTFGYVAPHTTAQVLARHLAARGCQAGNEPVVVDAGAGTGLVGGHLARLGFSHIIGVDLSPAMLHVARQKGCYHRLICADLADQAALAEGSADALVAVGTLLQPNHVTSGSVVRQWLRWLKPRGVLCFSVRDDLWAAQVEEEGGVGQAFAQLEESGDWRLVERTPSAAYTPHVNDVTFHVRTYYLPE